MKGIAVQLRLVIAFSCLIICMACEKQETVIEEVDDPSELVEISAESNEPGGMTVSIRGLKEETTAKEVKVFLTPFNDMYVKSDEKVISYSTSYQSIEFEGLQPGIDYYVRYSVLHFNGFMALRAKVMGPKPELGEMTGNYLPDELVYVTGTNLHIPVINQSDVLYGEVSVKVGDTVYTTYVQEFIKGKTVDSLYFNTPKALPPGNHQLVYSYDDKAADTIEISILGPEISSYQLNNYGTNKYTSNMMIRVWGENFHKSPYKFALWIGENGPHRNYTSDGLGTFAGFHVGGLTPGERHNFYVDNGGYKVLLAENVLIVDNRPLKEQEPTPFALEGLSSFKLGNTAYIVGGVGDGSYSEKVYAYDLTSRTWIEKGNFPGGGRAGGVALAIGEYGYYGFGYNNETAYLNDWWRYDPGNDAWEQVTGLSEGIVHGTGFVLNAAGYVGGGLHDGTRSGNFFRYTPGQDQWSSIAPYPLNEERLQATTYNDIAYVGGGNGNGLQPNGKFFTYTAATNSWEELPPLNTSSNGSATSHGYMFAKNDKIYYFFGFNSEINSYSYCWIYYPESGEWHRRKLDVNAETIHRPSAYTGFSDAEFFYMVGGNLNGATTDSFFIYDPKQELFD